MTCSTPTLRLVATALIALGVGCGEETWPTHVACVGDSITFGDGAAWPSETYPAYEALATKVREVLASHPPAHRGERRASAPGSDG